MLTQKFRAPRGRLPTAALQTGTDTWTNREKICLVEAIQSLGTDDWNEVSKFLHELTKGTRTKDWCSPQNCSWQFQSIMETTGRQIRKRDGDKDLLAAIRQHYVNERLNEIQILAEDSRQKYINLMKFNKDVESGLHDNRMSEILAAYGPEASLEEPEEEGNSGFYFAELSDLNEKISLINSFIQQQIGIASTSQPPATTEEVNPPETIPPVPSVPAGEEDEDLADLMDILPDIEFNTEDFDATVMETTEFGMMSPPDSTATRKGPSASPKVSPQLKNLVRTAIAGTSEDERPRNLTPSAGAPTLSMLLEMPPRDPGQPLPEIATVTKAASSVLEPSRQDRVSPYRSPAAATLEQLNIALANSPSHYQSPTKAKSSSPTLQRLLEGTMPIKKETEDKSSAQLPSFSFIPPEEIKQEVEQGPAAQVVQNQVPPSPATTTSSPQKLPAEVAPALPLSPMIEPDVIVEPKEEVIEVVSTPETQTVVVGKSSDSQPTPVLVPESEAAVEIKEEKPDATEEVIVPEAEEHIDVQPLPQDVQEKVNNLKDLVVTQNTGMVTPKASPVKPDAPDTEELTGEEEPEGEKSPVPLSPPVAQDAPENVVEETVDIKEEVLQPASPEIPEAESLSGSIAMPVLQPVVELVPIPVPETKDDTAVGKQEDAEAMDVDEPEEPALVEQKQISAPAAQPIESTAAAAAADSDEELVSRKKILIPAKTYSRKERYGEPTEIEDEDDSSNSTFETSVKISSPSRTSPVRSIKSPPKTVVQTEVKRGRKSRVSESLAKQAELDLKEEAARVTRARSKPGSPQKVAPKAVVSVKNPEVEAHAEPAAPRSTRSRASTVPAQSDLSGTSAKKSVPEERETSTTQDELPTPGRATRGRISSTTKVLDSLPVLESNPSSPCSSTATSTTTDEDKEQRAFRKSISILWDQIKSHKHAGQFLKPITDVMVPNYSKKVYRGMDLTTIKRHIDSGIIRNIQSFERDIYLMLMNAIMYNSSDHEIHQRTLEMEQDVRTMLENYKSTQKALKAAQMMETMGSDSVLRSPVKLRSSLRRQKISDSDADEVPIDESHSGIGTPLTPSDVEMEDADARGIEQKTRESSPDITSAVSSSGVKRRSRTSSPSSVQLAMTSAAAAKAERTQSIDSKNRTQSPDVNAHGHSSRFEH